MTTMRWTVTLPLLVALAGCYEYVPVQELVQPQGTRVRASLDSVASFELAQYTVNNVNQVEGEVVGLDRGDLVLSAMWLEAISGNGFQGDGWTVRIPEADLRSLERRRLSWLRTGIAVGGLVAATVFSFDALGLSQSSGTGGGGTTPIN